MSGEGLRPRAGARYVLERVDETAPDVALYRGHIYLPETEIPVEVRVELPGGAARATLGSGREESEPEPAGQGDPSGGTVSRKEFERMAAALVRSATKAASASTGLPRRIVRWRG